MAVVPGLAAICWLRGFKPENRFLPAVRLALWLPKTFHNASDPWRTWSHLSTSRNTTQVRHPSAILPPRIRSTPYIRNDRQFHRSSLSTDPGTSLASNTRSYLAHHVNRSIAVFSGSKACQSPGSTTGLPRSGISLRVDLSLCEVNFLFCRKSGPAQRGIISGRISRVPRVPDCPVSLYLVVRWLVAWWLVAEWLVAGG